MKHHSSEARELFGRLLKSNSKIIDIGSGPDENHAAYFRKLGHIVDVCDFHETAKYKGDFNNIDIPEIYDAVWSSHCLEHQLNVNFHLRKVHKVLKENGLLCVTVPPLNIKL
jgi:predicted SAM-dependent methyltransferase